MKLPGFSTKRGGDLKQWTMQPCFVCKKKIGGLVRRTLCEDCMELHYETLAREIDPSYAPAAVNDGERVRQAFFPLYGVLEFWDRFFEPEH